MARIAHSRLSGDAHTSSRTLTRMHSTLPLRLPCPLLPRASRHCFTRMPLRAVASPTAFAVRPAPCHARPTAACALPLQPFHVPDRHPLTFPLPLSCPPFFTRALDPNALHLSRDPAPCTEPRPAPFSRMLSEPSSPRPKAMPCTHSVFVATHETHRALPSIHSVLCTHTHCPTHPHQPTHPPSPCAHFQVVASLVHTTAASGGAGQAVLAGLAGGVVGGCMPRMLGATAGMVLLGRSLAPGSALFARKAAPIPAVGSWGEEPRQGGTPLFYDRPRCAASLMPGCPKLTSPHRTRARTHTHTHTHALPAHPPAPARLLLAGADCSLPAAHPRRPRVPPKVCLRPGAWGCGGGGARAGETMRLSPHKMPHPRARVCARTCMHPRTPATTTTHTHPPLYTARVQQCRPHTHAPPPLPPTHPCCAHIARLLACEAAAAPLLAPLVTARS